VSGAAYTAAKLKPFLDDFPRRRNASGAVTALWAFQTPFQVRCRPVVGSVTGSQMSC
jgi:hypothetical protein